MAATTALHNFMLKNDSGEDVDFSPMAEPINSQLYDAYVGHNDLIPICDTEREKVLQRWFILWMK